MGGLCGLQSRGALRCRQPEKLWRFMKGPPFPFSLCSELHSWSRMRNHPHAEVIDVSLIVSLKLREPDLMLQIESEHASIVILRKSIHLSPPQNA